MKARTSIRFFLVTTFIICVLMAVYPAARYKILTHFAYQKCKNRFESFKMGSEQIEFFHFELRHQEFVVEFSRGLRQLGSAEFDRNKIAIFLCPPGIECADCEEVFLVAWEELK